MIWMIKNVQNVWHFDNLKLLNNLMKNSNFEGNCTIFNTSRAKSFLWCKSALRHKN